MDEYYTLRVGFDWDSPQQAGAGDSLKYEFVDDNGQAVEPVEDPKADVPRYVFHEEDRIGLEIFDLSAETDLCLISRVATSVVPLFDDATPPQEAQLNPCGQLPPGMVATGRMTPSGWKQSSWDESEVPFWIWRTLVQLTPAGHYKFSLALSVYHRREDECRIFKFDPEMQVEPDDPAPGEDTDLYGSLARRRFRIGRGSTSSS